MTVQTKQTKADDKVIADDTNNAISTRSGKEHDAIFQQEEKLLHQVKEKYKEADSAAEKQLADVIGREIKIKGQEQIPPDLSDHGVVAPDVEASEVLKKDGTLVVNTTQEELDRDLKEGVGGKRYINKTIVGAKSALAWALRLSRIIKVAHKHARRVIFGKPQDMEVEKDAN